MATRSVASVGRHPQPGGCDTQVAGRRHCKRKSLISATCRAGTRPKMWTVVFVINLDIDAAEAVINGLDGVLPIDTWYYGSREDHVTETEGIHEVLHTCICVLVGRRVPCPPKDIESAVRDLVWQHDSGEATVCSVACPDHLDARGIVKFKAVHNWVVGVLTNVVVVKVSYDEDGLRSEMFGYSYILTLLRWQFGSAVELTVTEALLARMSEDEQAGIFQGGFAPLLAGARSLETVYVHAD